MKHEVEHDCGTASVSPPCHSVQVARATSCPPTASPRYAMPISCLPGRAGIWFRNNGGPTSPSRWRLERVRLAPSQGLAVGLHEAVCLANAVGVISGSESAEDALLFALALESHDPEGSFAGNQASIVRNSAEKLRKCESPAEARMLIHLHHEVGNLSEVETQFPLCDGDFRADLACLGPEPVLLAVEVDGHEWHERTKDQAERDKARERRIVSSGWAIARFAGSEVWRAPARCAREVKEMLSSLQLRLEALEGSP